MNLIVTTILSYWHLGRKIKPTPSGWLSGNAPCCHHRGEKADTRGRGGLIITGEGFRWHCFNCNFKAGWTPGHVMTKNTKNLLLWLGVPDVDVQKLALNAIKHRDELTKVDQILDFELLPKPLPDNSKTFAELTEKGCTDPEFINAVEYVLSRKFGLDWYSWMWSPENGYRDRVIIPYYHEDQVVGWTARKITDGKPKYLASSQPSYVFNLDRQGYNRKFVIVVEGPMDAIPIDGIAVLSNELNDAQIARINGLGREVILVPDNDEPGTKLIDVAIEQGWSASSPDWGNDVKDVARAVEKYGRVYTLATILKYREHGQIKLTMMKKRILNAASKT